MNRSGMERLGMPPVFNPGRQPLRDLPTAICLACQWEAVAAKPGNVHRSADFADIGLLDFLHSAVAVSNTARQWLARWSDQDNGQPPTFGQFVFEAVQSTRQLTRSNTNLGICLLLGPLVEAWVKRFEPIGTSQVGPADSMGSGTLNQAMFQAWRQQTQALINSASVEQTQLIYSAIGLAKPGGMGTVPEADVAAADALQSSDTVAQVMRLAVDRDSIAAEYVSGYSITFEKTVPSMAGLLSSGCGLQWTIIGTYLRLLADQPDTLIARKVGWDRAREISVWARQLADEFFPHSLKDWASDDREVACEQSLADFDFALRSDGNRLNPGTTADLIAAGLFVAAMGGIISTPVRW